MQGVRRGGHLRAPPEKEHVQGLRRGEHLPARSDKVPMQGVRRGEHLPARSIESGALARHAKQTRTIRCLRISRSFSFEPDWLKPICVLFFLFRKTSEASSFQVDFITHAVPLPFVHC